MTSSLKESADLHLSVGRGDSEHHANAQRVWRQYFETSERLRVYLEAHLKDSYSLTLGDYNVLLTLSEHGGSMRLGDIASAIVFSKSRLTYQIKTMERRGLVTRHECHKDGRGISAKITAKGRRVFRRAARGHTALIDDVFIDGLTAQDVLALQRVCERVERRISK